MENITNIKDIGRALRSKREEKKLSLDTVHAETRISIRYLRALENGDLSQFPAEVYLTGSLRHYARFLGLDAATVVAAYYALTREQKEEKPAAQPKKAAKQPRSLTPLLVIIVLALTAIYFWISMGPRRQTEQPPRQRQEQPQLQQPQQPQQKPLKKEAPVTQDLRLSAKGKDSVWLRVTADNVMVFEGVLLTGGTREWTAKTQFIVKVGYAPGVELTLNGVSIDPTQGAQQDVNTLTLNWNTIKSK